MGGSSVSRLGGTMAQSCEACKHGAQPIKQREQVGRLVVRRQSEDLHSLDRGRGFRCFAARAAKAGESVAAGTAGRFCDTSHGNEFREPAALTPTTLEHELGPGLAHGLASTGTRCDES